MRPKTATIVFSPRKHCFVCVPESWKVFAEHDNQVGYCYLPWSIVLEVAPLSLETKLRCLSRRLHFSLADIEYRQRRDGCTVLCRM